jgi:L-lactate dehydrogenase complex protein LldG
MSARDAILANVRAAIGPARGDAPETPRDYRTATDDDRTTFLDRLARYEATTHEVEADAVDSTVRRILEGRRIVVPAGIPDAWLTGVTVLRDDPPLENHALDEADGVLTTCALAIAQTATIILDGGPGMGRRALTLLPDYHLCIVKAEQIVSSVPEAIRAIGHTTRPLTFISGPSATVDIEMVRVKGVHGPRRLEVIVVNTASSDPET